MCHLRWSIRCVGQSFWWRCKIALLDDAKEWSSVYLDLDEIANGGFRDANGNLVAPEAKTTSVPRWVTEYANGTLSSFVDHEVRAAVENEVPAKTACERWHSGAFLLETIPCVLQILALHGLGLLAHYRGDEREAETLAQQALRIAQESWQRRAERFALRLLGHALFGRGKLEQAQSAYQQVLEIDQTLGYSHLAVEATADLARVALAEGDLAHATAYADAVLEYLAEHTLEGTEEPLGVYLTCYAVLRAAQNPRATDVLAAGHALLQERAAQFDDEERRRMFLENQPAHP